MRKQNVVVSMVTLACLASLLAGVSRKALAGDTGKTKAEQAADRKPSSDDSEVPLTPLEQALVRDAERREKAEANHKKKPMPENLRRKMESGNPPDEDADDSDDEDGAGE